MTELTKERFLELKAWIDQDCSHHSSMTAIYRHPGFAELMGGGDAVVKLMLEDLREDPHWYWFWPLHSITKDNPIKDGHQGYLDKVTEDWLEWGKDNGYLEP